ncbi:hypothetical protein WME90_06500 [Sorangium sp. So ce375]
MADAAVGDVDLHIVVAWSATKDVERLKRLVGGIGTKGFHGHLLLLEELELREEVGSALLARRLPGHVQHYHALGADGEPERRLRKIITITITSQAAHRATPSDGAFILYLDVLKLLEPHLKPGAIIIGENAFEQASGYIDYVRKPQNGYLSQPLPFEAGRGNELTIETS